MIKSLLGRLALVATLAAPPAAAAAFDYYLLALSWTPSWCAAEGAARGDPACAPGADRGFTLHGLWPQDEDGWPEYCASAARDPTRAETAAMADVMGSGGLAWYQWTKHGRCSGLGPEAYFAAARAAYRALDLPEPAASATPADVEAAILAANPGLAPEQLIVTCRDARLAEVRLCLTRELAPRACAPDVARDACRDGTRLDVPPR